MLKGMTQHDKTIMGRSRLLTVKTSNADECLVSRVQNVGSPLVYMVSTPPGKFLKVLDFPLSKSLESSGKCRLWKVLEI